MTKEMKQFVDELPEEDIIDRGVWDDSSIIASWMRRNQQNKLKFVKWYFDKAKRFLKDKTNIENIKKELGDLGAIDYTHDEVIFNNYEIVGSYVIAPKNYKNKNKFALDCVENDDIAILDLF